MEGGENKLPAMLKSVLKVGHQISTWGTSSKAKVMILSATSCNSGENGDS